MKLYKIEYTGSDIDQVRYSGTQSDAKTVQKELERIHGRHNVADYEPVEVPTDKPGLIAWLNTYAGKG